MYNLSDYLVIRQESQRVVNVYVVGTNDISVRTNRTNTLDTTDILRLIEKRKNDI